MVSLPAVWGFSWSLLHAELGEALAAAPAALVVLEELELLPLSVGAHPARATATRAAPVAAARRNGANRACRCIECLRRVAAPRRGDAGCALGVQWGSVAPVVGQGWLPGEQGNAAVLRVRSHGS